LTGPSTLSTNKVLSKQPLFKKSGAKTFVNLVPGVLRANGPN
jgi:hypothetical protein